MLGGDFLDRREDSQYGEQAPSRTGLSVQRSDNQNFENDCQPSSRETNWNHLSPQTKIDQMHYKRVREQPEPFHENEEWLEDSYMGIIDAPVARKRLGSPQSKNEFSSKRLHGQLIDHSAPPLRLAKASWWSPGNVTTQDRRLIDRNFLHQKHPQFHSSVSSGLGSPYKYNSRGFLPRESQSGDDNNLPRGQSRDLGQRVPQIIPYQQQNSVRIQRSEVCDPADLVVLNDRKGAMARRQQIDVPDLFRNPLNYQRAMSMVPDVYQSYRGPQPVFDLTTTESVGGWRTAAQSTTNSASPALRKATATELIDLDIDADIKCKGGHLQGSFQEVGGIFVID